MRITWQYFPRSNKSKKIIQVINSSSINSAAQEELPTCVPRGPTKIMDMLTYLGWLGTCLKDISRDYGVCHLH